MKTTVTTKNMVSIPQAIARSLGIQPGWKLDWRPGAADELIVTVIPDRAERSRRLRGAGQQLMPDRDAVADLVAERAQEL